MKRFKWPLQRLLDVTAQKERADKAKLLGLSRRIADVHREIFQRQAPLRSILNELSETKLEKRIPEQQNFMRCSQTQAGELNRLKEKLTDLKKQRSEAIAVFTKTKSARETLERLKEESIQRYNREANRQQQKQQDESAGIAFVRKMIRHRAG